MSDNVNNPQELTPSEPASPVTPTEPANAVAPSPSPDDLLPAQPVITAPGGMPHVKVTTKVNVRFREVGADGTVKAVMSIRR